MTTFLQRAAQCLSTIPLLRLPAQGYMPAPRDDPADRMECAQTLVQSTGTTARALPAKPSRKTKPPAAAAVSVPAFSATSPVRILQGLTACVLGSLAAVWIVRSGFGRSLAPHGNVHQHHMITFESAFKGAVELGCSYAVGGANITNPPTIFSENGEVYVNFTYSHGYDDMGQDLFCFKVHELGIQNPIIDAAPGDWVTIDLCSALTANTSAGDDPASFQVSNTPCGNVNPASLPINGHLHGVEASPQCGADNSKDTYINPGNCHRQRFQIGLNHAEGGHPIHGHTDEDLSTQGNAVAFLYVRGIENEVPQTAGLYEITLKVGDTPLLSNSTDPSVPAWDLRVADAAIRYDPALPGNYTAPPVLYIRPTQPYLFRLSTNSANTAFNISVEYDGQVQNLEVVSFDGTPLKSGPNTVGNGSVIERYLVMQPMARRDFILAAPSMAVQSAYVYTNNYYTGPAGDNDPRRWIAQIRVDPNAVQPDRRIPQSKTTGYAQPCDGWDKLPISAAYNFMFDETTPSDPDVEPDFFLTNIEQARQKYSPNMPFSFEVNPGAKLQLNFTNPTNETHALHIHNHNYLVVAIDGVAIPKALQRCVDSTLVPYWDWMNSPKPPSITVEIAHSQINQGPILVHCHFGGHFKKGMGNVYNVKTPVANRATQKPSHRYLGAGAAAMSIAAGWLLI